MTRTPSYPPPAAVKPEPPCKPPRPTGAPWFLRGDEMQSVMSDPRAVAEHLLHAIPPDARAAIIAFAKFGLTGSVTLSFSEGRAGAYESKEHHRLGAA